MSNHRRPDSFTHDEPEPRAAESNRLVRSGHRSGMDHEIPPPDPAPLAHGEREVGVTAQTVRLRQHPELLNRRSGGQRSAALTATRRHDCPTCTGTHTKTEAVNPRAASVVRLERPLALGHGQHSSKFGGASRRRWYVLLENLVSPPGRCDDATWPPGPARNRHPPQGDCLRVLIRACQVKLAHATSIRSQQRPGHSAAPVRSFGAFQRFGNGEDTPSSP